MKSSNKIALSVILALLVVTIVYYRNMGPATGGNALTMSPRLSHAAEPSTGSGTDASPSVEEDLQAKILRISREAAAQTTGTSATQPAADGAAPGPATTQPAASTAATQPATDSSSGFVTPPPATTGGLQSERDSLGLHERTPPHEGMADTGAGKTYAVQAGDSFSSIAKKFLGAEKHWSKIAQANPSVDPERLKIGQVLRIPEATDDHTSHDSTDSGSSYTPTGDGTPYTIKSGDTLSTIAKQFYNSSAKWKVIYEANRAAIGNDPARLKEGLKITIPPAPSSAR
ncbi:MAG: LysM peptidoglycan-binding domain-containing protein [Planctomycetes bacterium]|nr:LysM peptidoglycan-binding domain-containing protein [Planctomycetota bacterium]